MIVRALLLLIAICPTLASAADPIPLQAGRVSMIFEPDLAMLRYIRVGPHPILQGINAPVRDQFWGTVAPKVQNLKVRQEAESFTLTFDVECRRREIHYFWQGRIAGNSAGKIEFRFDGVARSDFKKNRIGFCVLHGPEVAGQECVVETVQGKTVRGRFPQLIAPHQPFQQLRAVSHPIAPGVWARVLMQGDTFEMEDQRNWTDASFKTYCTPLEEPYPVSISEGHKISQRVEITLEGLANLPADSQSDTHAVDLRLSTDDQTIYPLPGIGLQVSSQTRELTDRQVSMLKQLRLHHLRVDLVPAEHGAAEELSRAASQAEQIGARLTVGLHLGERPADELEKLKAVLKTIAPPATWLVISGTDAQVAATRKFLRQTMQPGRLGQGEDTNFTELNRNRPDVTQIDAVSYGVNPQIHAFDNTSMVETLAIQGETVRSARHFSAQHPLIVSPITLKPQQVNQPPAAGERPANVDPRQTSMFTAAWTLGSFKYLSEAGAAELTYFETVGWLGVMESQSGTPAADHFPSRPGQLFPTYYVLRELADFRGGQVRPILSNQPLSVVGLAVEQGSRRRILIANLTSADHDVVLAPITSSYQRDRIEAMPLLPSTGTDRLPPSVVQPDEEGRLRQRIPAHGILVLDRSVIDE